MSHSVVVATLAVYFGLNLLCALVLHVHAVHEAHLRLRFLDVLVHFVLLTAFALPVLLVVTAEALFGGNGGPDVGKVADAAHAGARAA